MIVRHRLTINVGETGQSSVLAWQPVDIGKLNATEP